MNSDRFTLSTSSILDFNQLSTENTLLSANTARTRAFRFPSPTTQIPSQSNHTIGKVVREEEIIERRARDGLLRCSVVLIWAAVSSICSFLWTILKAVGGILLVGFTLAVIGSYVSPHLQFLPHSLAQIPFSTTQFLSVVQRTFLTNTSMDVIENRATPALDVLFSSQPIVPTEIMSSPFPTISDIARFSNGASIIPALTTSTARSSTPSFLHKLHTLWHGVDMSQIESNPPLVILEDSSTDCWEFQGRQGHVTISFPDTSVLKSVLFNFPDQKLVTADRLHQAPRELHLWALTPLEQLNMTSEDLLESWQRFVTVEELVDSSFFNSSVAFFQVAQLTYNPLDGQQDISLNYTVPTSTIVLEIRDNWGDDSTCLYGIQVYGHST
ncbi:hypothetical protein DFH05DRAFT_1530658 [Lentinula detonsa]|uniref:SUN domain-containing protein n=1 Tax=Lentinula detonsa TaxID=2804962 RepID=A0A9W8TSZ5_9AGAR|nr:hypothetical protein DFH05DRAFT_1530658 [Lentinula detonsa]KAJ3793439.1 hypothetical protein GGU11DRAFT_748894 [Lentinula aff. detonsa]KAJ3979907.1 hypothetical protein F5890DRAFT_1558208 [Lentinula detonsa]